MVQGWVMCLGQGWEGIADSLGSDVSKLVRRRGPVQLVVYIIKS